MAKYSVISDVSRTIVDLLRAELVPEPVAQAEQIGACDPHERGSCVVGVHIYDIAESGEMRPTGQVLQPDGSLRNAPVSLYLSLMISVRNMASAVSVLSPVTPLKCSAVSSQALKLLLTRSM